MDSLLPLLRRDKLRVYVACQDEARPKWETVRIPTLALLGEDDEYVDPTKNMALLAGFNNARITTGLFPRADHNLKKAFNPTKYPDIDWPRRIDACYEFVAQWLGNNVLRRQTR
jgi:hypothetical protein